MQTFVLSSPHYTLIHTRTQWLLLYKKWAACLPMWGKVLTQLGQGACPCWAELLADTCPISSFCSTPIPFPWILPTHAIPVVWIPHIWHKQTIQTIGWQLDNSQLAGCQNITTKNQTIWQFFSFLQFFINSGGGNSSISIGIKQFCP